MKALQRNTKTLLALLMCLLFAGKSAAQEPGEQLPMSFVYPFPYAELADFVESYDDLSFGLKACIGKDADYASAVPHLQQEAKQGSGLAMAVLGDLYARGRGVKADRQIAMNMFDKAIQAKCVLAHCYRGEMYRREGKSDEVLEEYRKAGQGCTYAVWLASVHAWKKEDYESAIQGMEIIYNRGQKWMAGTLGSIYVGDEIVPADYEKAFEYFTSEDTKYYINSELLLLAQMLYYGLGTGEDADQKMQKWKSDKYKTYYYKKGESGQACITDALVVLDKLMGENYEPAKELYHTVKADHDERERLSNIVVPPSFTDEGTRYFQRATMPRPPAIETAGHGEIVVRARISTSGHVQSVTLAERVLQRLDEEALNLVRNMPRMDPGTKGGFPTEMYVNIVVRYFPYYKVSMRGYSVAR